LKPDRQNIQIQDYDDGDGYDNDGGGKAIFTWGNVQNFKKYTWFGVEV
jgi:hypothetical protein